MNFKKFVVALLFYLSSFAYSQNIEGLVFNFFGQEFKSRRNAIITLMDSNSAIVMKTNEKKVRSNDVFYPYKPENNFFYLSGIEEPDFFLIITKNPVEWNNRNFSSFLFAPIKSNDTLISNEDDVILSKQKFYDFFNHLLKNIKTLYLSAPDYKTVHDWLNNKVIITEKEALNKLKEKFPDLQVKKVSILTSKLREIKSQEELEYLQRAIDITRVGLIRAIKNCKDGAFEYEIQSEIEYEFKRQGASGVAFPSIIGSGENSLILHYDENKKQMQNGEVLLIDVGAEYNWYSADITRTIPVSGKFTDAQKEVYSIVLKAQNEVIKIIKPGITFKELDNKAKQIIAEAGYEKFIKHSVSHTIGLDVHDVLTTDTLKAGMVITVEPGVYIPNDAADMPLEYRGFGIRIEDNVLVTEDGCKILSKNIPKEINEIEDLMKKH